MLIGQNKTFFPSLSPLCVCVCVRACERACVRARVCACVCACVCVHFVVSHRVEKVHLVTVMDIFAAAGSGIVAQPTTSDSRRLHDYYRTQLERRCDFRSGSAVKERVWLISR